DCGRRDAAVASDVVAESEHLLLTRDCSERPVDMHAGDEEMERVRPEIEGCGPHPAWPSGPRPQRASSEHRPGLRICAWLSCGYDLRPSTAARIVRAPSGPADLRLALMLASTLPA